MRSPRRRRDYFNPRSREGSDVQHIIPLTLVDISIHAPAKGATDLPWSAPRPHSRFQSTLPRRERRAVATPGVWRTYFNPRSREGSDDFQFAYIVRPNDFNPRSREGSDRSGRSYNQSLNHFNPRSREGSDHANLCTLCNVLYFNPRSREGSDLNLQVHSRPQRPISIHAPAKGATLC